MSLARRLFSIDLRTLALLRVGTALVILGDVADRARHLTLHYTDYGFLPRWTTAQTNDPLEISLHFASGSPGWQAFLFGIQALVALALLVGWRTRIVSVVSWLLLLSVHNRAQNVLHGGDVVLRALAFWGMFAPWGAVFSVDRALASPSSPAPPKMAFSVGTVALLLQGFLVYFITGMLKTGPEWQHEGSAIHYALWLRSFAKPPALWLQQFPDFLWFATFATLIFEILGPLLLFSPVAMAPLRLFVIVGVISLHVGIWINLNVGMHTAASSIIVLAFFPPEPWDWLARKIRTPQRLGAKLFFDSSRNLSRKAALLARTFLLLPETPVSPLPADAPSSLLVVEDFDGTRREGWDAFVLAVRRSALFWPLAPVLGFGPVAGLARMAGRLGARLGADRGLNRLLRRRPVRIELSRLSQVLCAGALGIILWSNAAVLARNDPNPETSWAAALELRWPVNRVATLFWLYQDWNMFAPSPGRVDGWLMVPAKLANGAEVDLLTGQPPADDPPPRNRPLYANAREMGHMRRLWSKHTRVQGDALLDAFAKCLTRRWNLSRAPAERVASLKVVAMLETSPRPGRRLTPARPHVIWEARYGYE